MGRLVVGFLAAAALLAVTPHSHAQSRCAKISFAAERAKLEGHLHQLHFSDAQIAYAKALVARKAAEFPADLLTPSGRTCGLDAISGSAVGCMREVMLIPKRLNDAKPLNEIVDVPPTVRSFFGSTRATVGELAIFSAATICFAGAAEATTTAP